MPDELTASLTLEKNKPENVPIMLYEWYLPDSTVLRLAEWGETVEYPAGSNTVYLPFPITHEGISANAMGEIDSVKVSVSSVSRAMPGLLETFSGLTGCRVVMKLVFLALLGNPDDHIDNVYWVDYAETSETECIFYLTSKLDLFQVQLPGRLYERDHCQWVYKDEGCWLLTGGVFVAPDDFVNESTECDHTLDGEAGCKFHGNSKRFGGFPGIPLRGVYSI